MDRKKIRKRKRPSYLNDFLEDHIEDERVQKNKSCKQESEIQKEKSAATKIKVEPMTDKCCLCEEDLTKRFDIETSTGSSELTFSGVLNKMFAEEDENVPKLNFSSGFLCTFCKVPIQDLDLLQHKVMGIKKVILTRANKKIQNIILQQELKKEESKKENEVSKVKKSEKPKEKNFMEKEGEALKIERKNTKNRRKPKPAVVESESEDDIDEIDLVRPKREKPTNVMSDIERAKIKNLPIDLKFQVKKRSKADPYIIEYLKEKKGSMFLVKWENRHEDENTWENRSKIPPDVLQYYEEDLRRLGTQVPITIPGQSKGDNELEVLNDTSVRSKVDNEGEVQKDKEIKVVGVVKSKRLAESISDKVDETDSYTVGEYIEPLCEDLFFNESNKNEEQKDNHQKESQIVRKSKREPKPKSYSDEFLLSNPLKAETIKVENEESTDHDSSIRKSRREPKPKKFEFEEAQANNEKSTKHSDSIKSKSPKKKAKPAANDTYIIEALVKKKDDKYLVKWENYPSSQNTWEPKSAIPKFIIKFYEQDLSRLGMPAPDVS